MEWMLTPKPNPWKMGITANILSPGLNILLVAMIWAARALKFKLESKIPLVFPVVPPLYKIAAGSSAFLLTAYSAL